MALKIKLPQSKAFTILVDLYPSFFSFFRGTKVTISQQRQPGFTIKKSTSELTIFHHTMSDLLRALGELFVAGVSHSSLTITKEPPFDFRGIMIDCSRNGVITVDYLKKIIPPLALMGLNYLTLYTEDTYEISGHPEIGYMRGAYSKKELRDIVKYAELFGITMFPCIQTLGHLEQVLKLPKYEHLKDDFSILSVNKRESYVLIEAMIRNAIEPYATKLIHIGMDETWGLGRGTCFEKNKKIDPRQIYLEHLRKVNAICKRYRLQPIMWGDIVTGMHTPSNKMSRKQVSSLPKNVIMNFWNYQHTAKAYYKKNINHYRKMGFEPLLSPGLWNWNNLWGDYEYAKQRFVPFITAARESGVTRCMITLWGDDGQEAPFASNIPGLVHYLELLYTKKPKMDRIKKVVSVLFHDKFDNFTIPARMVEGKAAKGFLYDDPLLGFYSMHTSHKRYSSSFLTYRTKLKDIVTRASGDHRNLFRFAYRLADCLSIKADLRNKCRAAYRNKDPKRLNEMLPEIRLAGKKVVLLRDAHYRVWTEERKIQGWEILENRYGGVISRLQTMEKRIGWFLKGSLAVLEEFEEKDIQIVKKLETFRVTYNRVAEIPYSRW